ncbi:MAG: peptidoglycan-binding protein [Candidatus Paceibacterota bacterium]|jgi:N-acetylmuramoyl-L-alanine amidase
MDGNPNNKIVLFSKVVIVSSVVVIFFLVILQSPLSSSVNFKKIGQQLATVVLIHKPKTPAEIQQRYQVAVSSPNDQVKKVRIILMPGHEPGFGGTEFGQLKEREETVGLALKLSKFLREDPHFEVLVARNNNSWNKNLADYFQKNWNIIKDWRQSSHEETSYLVSIGSMKRIKPKMDHPVAPTDVAVRLYGLTKWANENDADIILHLHFNDYSRNKLSRPGKYSGLAIYVPDKQYGNGEATREIAISIFKRLIKYNPVSDLPAESEGIIDEQELIAIGANNTSDAASMLVEYSYIYEKQLVNPEIRDAFIEDLAYQTYLGLRDFFEPQGLVDKEAGDTTVLSQKLDKQITKKDSDTKDAYVLQTALIKAGVYPPINTSFNTCPRSGVMASCTMAAIDAFQKKYGIEDEGGIVGPKTLGALNKLIEG